MRCRNLQEQPGGTDGSLLLVVQQKNAENNWKRLLIRRTVEVSTRSESVVFYRHVIAKLSKLLL